MKRICAFALGLSLLATACADPVPPAAPTPVEPTLTDRFAGTLLALGSNQHPFIVQQVGGLTVTISDITPATTVGFGIGVPGLSGCTVIKDVRAVGGATNSLTGVMTAAGTFCIAVFDTGEVVDPVAYTVTVQHS
jgi:hypothetical protein